MIQEGMIIKCAKCGGAVIYNPATGKMLCQSCGYEAEAGSEYDMERGNSLNLDPFSEGASDYSSEDASNRNITDKNSSEEKESTGKIHFESKSSSVSSEGSSLGDGALGDGMLGGGTLGGGTLGGAYGEGTLGGSAYGDGTLGEGSLGHGFIDDRPIGADLFENESEETSPTSEAISLSLKAEPEEKKEDNLDWLYKSSLAGQPPSAEKAEKEFIKNFEKAYEQEHSYQELENFGEETVQLDRYICSSCGAILLLHGEQITKECGFCGNATITFDKVSDEKKPDKILPFKLSPEQAFECVKKEYSDKDRQKYTSPLVQNLKVTDIRGIYIPNWLYSGNVRKRMVFKLSDIGNDKGATYIKDARAEYKRVPIDAALNLNDEMTANLEPYDYSQLVDFKVDYLLGFYADKFDMTAAQGMRNAEKRFDAFMTKTLVDSFAENMAKDGPSKKSENNRMMYMYYPNRNYEVGNEHVMENEREINMTNIEYVFLPVYFVTLKAGNEVYTILVNGQTGKVTGNLPTSSVDIKPRFVKNTIIGITIFTLIEMAFAMFGLFKHEDMAFLVPLFLLVPIAIIGFVGGLSSYKEYKVKQQIINQGINEYTNRR